MDKNSFYSDLNEHFQSTALVAEVFLEPRRGTTSRESGEKRKTSGYLGIESHFHAHASCQTRQIDNYKLDQWQLSNQVSVP